MSNTSYGDQNSVMLHESNNCNVTCMSVE